MIPAFMIPPAPKPQTVKALQWPVNSIIRLSENAPKGASGQLIEIVAASIEDGVAYRYMGSKRQHTVDWFEWSDLTRGATLIR